MPSFVNNSSHFFHIDASSPRPCTNNTGEDGFPPPGLASGGRLTNEAKAANPIAITTTAIVITIINFVLTNFYVQTMMHHLILSFHDLILLVRLITF